jgi:hypothetical protein
MELRNCSIALREVLAGASLIFLIAAGVSVCTASAAYAQAVDGDGAPAMDYVATGDAGSDGNLDLPAPEGNLDVPAPAADYDVPAKAGSVAGADPETEASGGTDSVLELPQVVDPASNAVAALAHANPVQTDSNATLANGEAALTDSDAPLSDAEDGEQPGSGGDNAAADAPSGASISDAQDYQDQADSGPVVVYGAPVYVEPTLRYPAPIPGPAFPTIRAGAYNQRPIADAFRPHAVGLGRYQVGTGTRLFNSRLGRGFVMPHGPMAGARWAHSR